MIPLGPQPAEQEGVVKKVNIFEEGQFKDTGLGRLLVHESPFFKILNFNFKPGQGLPLHAHDLEGQVSIAVIEGEGEFLGQDTTLAAKAGDVLVADIAEPHGVRAVTDMRVLVTIAPPI
jgi:quercetin dioxygenase-like cupin family protein